MNGGKTLEELNSLWEESDHYDGEITPKSFWRYKNDIADTFQIHIEYNASSKLYELQDVEFVKKNRLLTYILLSFQLKEICTLIGKHKEKISVQLNLPIGIKYMPEILYAFEEKHYIMYRVRNNPSIQHKAIPCFITGREDRLYLVLKVYGENTKTNIFLYDICELILSTEKF